MACSRRSIGSTVTGWYLVEFVRHVAQQTVHTVHTLLVGVGQGVEQPREDDTPLNSAADASAQAQLTRQF